MQDILVTDSLFIFPEHEQALKAAGFNVVRLDKPQATEAELIEAMKGKVGYILGGIETLTDNIINSADSLKAIVFTGIGYKGFIPNWEYVTQKGIAIANTPDAPTYAVAEWSLMMALAMNRNIFDLGRAGDKKFLTTKGIEGQRIGIVGLGRIGSQITKMIKPFRPGKISYYSKHRHEASESELGIEYHELDEVLKESDIVFVCVSKDAGKDFIDAANLAMMPDGALLVSFIGDEVVNDAALLVELKKGRLRLASDHLITDPSANELPLSTYYCFNASNAFNTVNELKLTSDAATRSMINLLTTGRDENRVN
jgi:phosphoglycerate dehydrogenase-like enzyme